MVLYILGKIFFKKVFKVLVFQVVDLQQTCDDPLALYISAISILEMLWCSNVKPIKL